MIFSAASLYDQTTLKPEAHKTFLLLLTEKDLSAIRQGRTLLVTKEALAGHKCEAAAIGYFRTDQEALKALETFGGKAIPEESLAHVGPKADEVKCRECDGINKPWQLYQDVCIVCWAQEAKAMRRASN